MCETEMVLLAGGLVMKISADLGQSRWSRVLFIHTSHLMSNLPLHVNVGCCLRGNSDAEMKALLRFRCLCAVRPHNG